MERPKNPCDISLRLLGQYSDAVLEHAREVNKLEALVMQSGSARLQEALMTCREARLRCTAAKKELHAHRRDHGC